MSILSPRARKVLADLWANRTRTLLVVASIAVGAFAVGAITTTYVVFGEDIAVSYAAAQPAKPTKIKAQRQENNAVKAMIVVGASAQPT